MDHFLYAFRLGAQFMGLVMVPTTLKVFGLLQEPMDFDLGRSHLELPLASLNLSPHLEFKLGGLRLQALGHGLMLHGFDPHLIDARLGLLYLKHQPMFFLLKVVVGLVGSGSQSAAQQCQNNDVS